MQKALRISARPCSAVCRFGASSRLPIGIKARLRSPAIAFATLVCLFSRIKGIQLWSCLAACWQRLIVIVQASMAALLFFVLSRLA
jgi:hypothetical protein